jgi:hypothetical protein
MRKAFLFLVMVLIAAASTSGQTLPKRALGSITGTVVDSATGKPIVGAPVQILGTTMGALTGPDGRYKIINIPVGEYVLISRTLGYFPLKVTHVTVTEKETTNIKLILVFNDIESVLRSKRGIEWIGRDFFPISETQTMREISAEDIRHLPTGDLRNIMRLQSGVTVR